MIKFRTVFLSAALGCGMAFAADPALLQLVSPNAGVLAGIQVDQSKKSPFGQFMLSRMSPDAADMTKFVAATGFDPRRDLSEILFAGDALPTGKGSSTGVLVARGTFNPARIAGIVQAHGGVVTSFQGVDLMTGGNSNTWGIALLDTTTAAMGDLDSVKAVITRHNSGAPPAADIAAKVDTLGANNDFWFLTLAPLSSFAPVIPDPQLGNALQNGQLFQAVTQASGGVKFGDNIVFQADAVTRSDKDAQALADVIRFLSGMIQSSQENNPTVKQVATMLNSLVLTTNSNVMHMALTIPEAQAESLLTAARHNGAAHKSAVKAN